MASKSVRASASRRDFGTDGSGYESLEPAPFTRAVLGVLLGMAAGGLAAALLPRRERPVTELPQSVRERERR